jgi:cell division protein FtsZ
MVNWFTVSTPPSDMDLIKAIKRMDEELPVIKPVSVFGGFPAIKPLPPIGASMEQMLFRKTLPGLPPLPALEPPRLDVSIKKCDLFDNDDDLKQILDKRDVRTLVVGVGGAGNNMTSRFQELSIPGCRTLCINTDAQDLYYSQADEKVLIGKRITKGLGAGNNNEVGEMAASEDFERVKAVMDADIVFLTCGLGGGTGTGATPLVAKAAKERGSVVISIVTLPFDMEGPKKESVAMQGLKKLAETSDAVIPLANQKLMDLVPDIKIHQGFKIMDEILTRSVRTVMDLITKPGLVNMDFADIKSVIERCPNQGSAQDAMPYGASAIGMAEVSNLGDEHLKKYTIKALDNPLIEPDIKDIKHALVGITGDFNVNLHQVNTIVSTVQDNIHPDASIKWGFIQDPTKHGKIQISIMGGGFRSPLLDRAISLGDAYQ